MLKRVSQPKTQEEHVALKAIPVNVYCYISMLNDELNNSIL